jgi:hypothetical protein
VSACLGRALYSRAAFASHHSEIRETAMSRGSYLEDATWTA